MYLSLQFTEILSMYEKGICLICWETYENSLWGSGCKVEEHSNHNGK